MGDLGNRLLQTLLAADPVGFPIEFPTYTAYPLLVASPIPWEILARRVWTENHNFDVRLRLAARGGLAMTPIPEGQALGRDLTHPWTSVWHLIWRLRVIAERRLPQYAKLFEPVFASSPRGEFRAPCREPSESDLVTVLQGLNQNGVRPVAWLPGTVSALQAQQDRICCTTLGLPNCNTRGLIVYGLPKPYDGPVLDPTKDWPLHLCADPGFWALVMLEERGVPASVADRLWAKIIDGGLLGYYGTSGLGEAALMRYGGVIVARSVLIAVRNAIASSGASIAGDAIGLTELRAHVDRVSETVASLPILSQDAVGTAHYSIADLSSIRSATAPTSPTSIAWAGGLYLTLDGDAIPDGTPMPDGSGLVNTVLEPPSRTATFARTYGPWIAGGALVLGGGVWIWRRSRRSSSSTVPKFSRRRV